MVVLPPMTSAMRITAVALRPGDFQRMRLPNRTSCKSCSKHHLELIRSFVSVPADSSCNVSGNGLHVLVLDQLREYFFEGRKVHQVAQTSDAVFGFDLAFINNDDFRTDAL